MKYIIALDIGTTSTRAVLFDHEQNIVGMRQQEIRQYFPREAWVEQDPMDLWAATYGCMNEVLAMHGVGLDQVAAIGITNQRETTIVWEKATGRPVYNAIVWQCRRTAQECEALKKEGWQEPIRRKTGLLIDAYFSATKLKWILDKVDRDRSRARSGDLLFGTVDCWILWKLTEGRVHATDYTNASRTMLFNIHTLQWDQDLCQALDIPMVLLPQVAPSGSQFGEYIGAGDVHVPICGMAGDQQAALYGQMCWHAGEVKNTYGTGCFLLENIGDVPITSQNGLVTTIAAGRSPKPEYALEGSVFVGGAVVQWLRDEMRFVEESPDTAFFAEKLTDNGGVYFVPAFTGLGAPYWDMYARGAIYGLTRGTSRAHIIRAALEAIAYQTHDVLRAMEQDTGIPIQTLRVDGGASRNDFLMQFQADILKAQVLRPQMVETTALGAALLAGVTAGFWKDEEDMRSHAQPVTDFQPQMDETVRSKNLQGWQEAVKRTLH
jgi:glycerol kinase